MSKITAIAASNLKKYRVGKAPGIIPKSRKKLLLDVFRGEEKNRFRPHGYATGPGDLGRGVYYTDDRGLANMYGAYNNRKDGVVHHRVIEVVNPKIVTHKRAYEYAKQYGTVNPEIDFETEFPGISVKDAVDMHRIMRVGGAKKLRADLLGQGHKGMVALNSSGQLGGSEVVMYNDVGSHVVAQRGKKIWITRRKRYGKKGHK